jgi:hypothetical protein
MTSFASAFASLDEQKGSSSTTGEMKCSNQFSSVDLDQQINVSPSTVSSDQHSSYVSLTDAATLRADPSNVSRVPSSSSSSQELPFGCSTASVPSDRRISIADISKLTVSSSVAPTIDKFKQWTRSAYKCTKQTIFEKLGKTSRTVDVELDNQIEVR